MKKSVLVNLPIAVLWGFREYKRDEVPALNHSLMHVRSVNEVTDFIKTQGKVEPLELSILGNHALLTDGNHRIVAAKRLGYTTVPVNITVFFGEGAEIFYGQTLSRFKPLSQYLEFWLKKIFY